MPDYRWERFIGREQSELDHMITDQSEDDDDPQAANRSNQSMAVTRAAAFFEPIDRRVAVREALKSGCPGAVGVHPIAEEHQSQIETSGRPNKAISQSNMPVIARPGPNLMLPKRRQPRTPPAGHSASGMPHRSTGKPHR